MTSPADSPAHLASILPAEYPAGVKTPDVLGDENWDDRFGETGLNGNVNAAVLIGNALCAGGDFTKAGGLTVNYLARWDGHAWSPIGQDVSGNLAIIEEITVDRESIYFQLHQPVCQEP